MKSITWALAVLLVVTLAGCQDLSVENENSPDRTQVLATPADIEQLAGGTFRTFWEATQWCGQSMMFSTMADAHSASWGNWGMNDNSSEPRIAWNNSPSYVYSPSAEDEWFVNYRAISNAADVLRSIEDTPAEQFESAGVDVPRIRAFVNFVMGLSYGYIAATYDRGFLVDETSDLEGIASGAVELELQSYADVMAFAQSKLDRAIDIASNNDFTITAEEDWIFGLEVSSAELARLAHSYKARYAAAVARTPEERQNRDWTSIIQWIDNGVDDTFAPIGNDDTVTEWDCQKFYGVDPGTWSRADYRTIGPADVSGGYENWKDTPVAQRFPYLTETPDRRIAGPDGPETDGTDFTFTGVEGGPFPADRGTYHFSDRAPTRYKPTYYDTGGNGPMPVLLKAEMDLLRAEALLHTGGSVTTVAQLIDNTRVERGELASAMGAPVGSIDNPPNPLGSSADPNPVTLWSMLKYEFNVETMLSATGLNYFTDRGWGDLVEGTPLQLPVPGAELQTIGLQIYTFGGVGGDCAAGSPNGCSDVSSNASKSARQLTRDHDAWDARSSRRPARPSSPR